jgi:hypothetical protein
MKALETQYNGFRFRSRMEARWAVFMDALSVPFHYEPEAYDLDGLFYLPDFYLPVQGVFMEVKSPEADPVDWKKAEQLARFTGKKVFVICEPPTIPRFENFAEGGFTMLSAFEDEDGNIVVGEDLNHLWCECPRCHRAEIQYDGRADRIGCKCRKSEHGDRGHNYDSDQLIAAYQKANGFRFEPSQLIHQGVTGG